MEVRKIVRETTNRRSRLGTLLVVTLASALALSSCAGTLDWIQDRLPPPSEVEDGIMFRYHAPSARLVTLAGNFNNWGGTQGGGRYDPSINPMSDSNGDGTWTLVVPLPPGRYQYKFVIDGGVRWEQDPNNPDKALEGGIENSLVVVPPTVSYDFEHITGRRLQLFRPQAVHVDIALAQLQAHLSKRLVDINTQRVEVECGQEIRCIETGYAQVYGCVGDA